MEVKWMPNGSQMEPNGGQMGSKNGVQIGSKWGPNGVPRRFRELGRKKNARGRETPGQMAPKRAPFSEPCGVFLDNCSWFFQGRF